MTPPDSTDKTLPPSPETYRYPPAPGGLPPQGPVESHGAVFTEAYAFIPQAVMRDIVTSFLPHWQGLRAWVLARSPCQCGRKLVTMSRITACGMKA